MAGSMRCMVASSSGVRYLISTMPSASSTPPRAVVSAYLHTPTQLRVLATERRHRRYDDHGTRRHMLLHIGAGAETLPSKPKVLKKPALNPCQEGLNWERNSRHWYSMSVGYITILFCEGHFGSETRCLHRSFQNLCMQTMRFEVCASHYLCAAFGVHR